MRKLEFVVQVCLTPADRLSVEGRSVPESVTTGTRTVEPVPLDRPAADPAPPDPPAVRPAPPPARTTPRGQPRPARPGSGIQRRGPRRKRGFSPGHASP